MSSAAATAWDLDLIGMSHRSAPLDVLERLALGPTEIEAVYERLLAADGVRGALVLSTCNRTEIYAATSPGIDVVPRVLEAIGNIAGAQRLPEDRFIYRHRGRGSVEHLFRVACGLDSLILGEPQILGQVKDAYEQSRQRKSPSPEFDRVVLSAIRVGKKSRAETEIGKGAVSVASAAVHLSTRIFSDMSRCRVVVIGAGDTGKLAAEHFANHHPERLTIINRTRSRAEEVALSFGGMVADWADIPSLVADADVVACAVRSPDPVLNAALVAKAVRERPGRTLALLDLGLPRNVATDVNELANVFVHDLDSLRQVVDANLSRRKQEVPKVEALIEREIELLLQKGRAIDAGPVIAALREGVERMRAAEVARASRNLSEQEREAVDRATRAIVNKLLHGPTTAIRDFSKAQQEGEQRLALIQQIFANLHGDD